MRRSRRSPLLALVALLVPMSCSDDGKSSASGAMADLISRTPADAVEGEFTRIVLMDLDAATKLSGVARPDADASSDERTDWLQAVLGFDDDSDVAVLFPQLTERYIGDELRDKFGWTQEDVARFVEVQAVPDRFTILDTKGVTTADLDGALGQPDSDDVWASGEGDDETFVALDDATVVMSPTAGLLDDWRDAKDLLDKDDSMASMAEALDDKGVYGAMIIPEAPHAKADSSDDVERLPDFDSLAFGLAVDAGKPTAVLVYHYGSEAEAKDAVEQTRTVLTEKSDGGSRMPDLLTDVEVKADGSNVVAVGALTDKPFDLWNLQNNFDIAFAAS
jgi:hypothetical protein